MSTAIEKETAKLTANMAFTKFAAELAHFYECINFDKSYLDANAILFMNCGLRDLAEKINDILGEI